MNYYIIIIVRLLNVSVTFCGHFQGVFLRRIYYRDNTAIYRYKTRQQSQCTNIKYLKNILCLCIGLVVFVTYPS